MQVMCLFACASKIRELTSSRELQKNSVANPKQNGVECYKLQLSFESDVCEEKDEMYHIAPAYFNQLCCYFGYKMMIGGANRIVPHLHISCRCYSKSRQDFQKSFGSINGLVRFLRFVKTL